MKAQKHSTTVGVIPVERKKVVAISLLLLTAIAISLFGAFITAYSLLKNINYTVFQNEIPGAVFGAVIIFLGVRYYISVLKLKSEVYKATSKFSWNNFRKSK
jgi:hypothetical protein